MQVPFLDLRRAPEAEREELDAALARVVRSGRYVLGPELDALETEFAAYVGIPFAAGVGCGTDALSLALESSGAIEPGRGDEVITPALSAAFSALAICRAGAVPRFVDLDPATLQMDPDGIEPLVGERTRALLPVHLYGHACDLGRIGGLARKHRLAVVEDACQAHGSRLDGSHLGTAGRAAGFSFYPTKNLGALGDAGMVVSHDEALIRRVRQLRHGGQTRTYYHELLGRNSRLDEIQAAVLRVKLRTLEDRNQRRRQIAAAYDDAFSNLELQRLPVRPGLVPNRHLYPVRTPRRDGLRAWLRDRGIETLVHYPTPLPLQPALAPFVLPGQEFPVASRAAGELLSLPLYPDLAEEELHHIIRSVREFFRAPGRHSP